MFFANLYIFFAKIGIILARTFGIKMASKSYKKETLTLELLKIFRTIGYEAASLSKISEMTGLSKASLYHHYPNGKSQMIEEVLKLVEKWSYENIILPLRSKLDSKKKLEHIFSKIAELYDAGTSGCIFGALVYSDIFSDNSPKVKELINSWIDAIEQILVEQGFSKKEAALKAEDALIKIQGALVISKAKNKKSIFTRAIKDLISDNQQRI